MKRRKHGRRAKVLGAAGLVLAVAACVPVRPEQRAILAEPSMRFDQTTADSRANARVLENREGATGGGTLKGGGCGCN